MIVNTETSKIRLSDAGQPLQTISWSQKIADDHAWFKANANFLRKQCRFWNRGPVPSKTEESATLLYDLYNGKFPNKWFSHITDPLNAREQTHKKFPAKVRPTNILRTNIDLLIGEYNRRPFNFHVINHGEDGYNAYTEKLREEISKNLTEHFTRMAINRLREQGVPIEELPGEEEIELPWSVRERFNASYKDALAIYGEKRVDRIIGEMKLRKQFSKLFKHWLIAGGAYSYKGVEDGQFVYRVIGPPDIDYDKSDRVDNVEDGSWVVAREWETIPDVIDRFHKYLEKKDIDKLDAKAFNGFETIFNRLEDIGKTRGWRGKIPVDHVQWKGRKKVLIIPVVNEMGELEERVEVDEDYPIPEGVTPEVEWINEVYEVWCIGEDLFINPRAVPLQRNILTNSSSCKLSYNGARFSDTYSDNISVARMGVPYQIMHMIVGFLLEKTIAKSKGKILLVDKNAIPREKGWNEEKFFYYSDALGIGLLNRNQQGVDKSWNQYQVVDMGLFDHIENLINLQQHYATQWDEQLGITRQRKGQIMASDDVGNTQAATFQSNVITDSIFITFEDFIETELQGILDCSRFTDPDSPWAMWNLSDFDRELLRVDYEQYASAELGLIYQRSAQEQEKLMAMKQMLTGLAQAGQSPSVLWEIINANNMSKLRTELKNLEQLQQEAEQAAQEADAQAAEAADNRAKDFEQFKATVQNWLNGEEHKRDMEKELLKVSGNIMSFQKEADEGNDVQDINEIYKRLTEQQSIQSKERMEMLKLQSTNRNEDKKLALKEKELTVKERIEKLKARTSLKNKTSGER